MIKQCGNCEFWDSENARDSTQYENRQIAPCERPVDAAMGRYETYNTEGQDCPVYKEQSIASHHLRREYEQQYACIMGVHYFLFSNGV